jgi:hypothetical protein
VKNGVLRLVVLAIGIVASALCALAHPLPGSTLTISRVEAGVEADSRQFA